MAKANMHIIQSTLTKRELFAAMAMQGQLANAYLLRVLSNQPLSSPESRIAILTKASVECADALLKALEARDE